MKPRPLHPFPFLIAAAYPASMQRSTPSCPNRFEQQLLAQLRQGARLLFDMSKRRALLYRWTAGAQELAEITVRTLARLVRMGWLVMVGRMDRVVHYALSEGPQAQRAWYANADAV